MKIDYFSCENCGCVIDVEVIKKIAEKVSEEELEKQRWDSSYIYYDFQDFEHIRCPACKFLNQR